MNRFAIAVVLLSCLLCAGKLLAASSDVEKARQYGAQGQVTLRVTDSTGKPVEKAKLSVAFYPSDSYANVVVSEGQTDTNGLYLAEGRTVGDVTFTITREGFYKTRSKYLFYRPSNLDANKSSAISPTSGEYLLYHREKNSVKDGRWQPWNPTNTIIMKEKRDPIAMFAKNIDEPVPICDTPVGFDLQVSDWLAPHGKGKQSDLLFIYKAKVQDYWNASLEISIACTNQMAGFCRMKKDMGSTFRSAYEAPNAGYQPEVQFAFVTTTEKDLKVEKLGDAEYLAFRVRTVLDDKGNIVSARYGKIYGPIEFGVGKNHHVRFSYYLNPTDNDRNLEFDPEHNLLVNPGLSPVRMP